MSQPPPVRQPEQRRPGGDDTGWNPAGHAGVAHRPAPPYCPPGWMVDSPTSGTPPYGWRPASTRIRRVPRPSSLQPFGPATWLGMGGLDPLSWRDPIAEAFRAVAVPERHRPVKPGILPGPPGWLAVDVRMVESTPVARSRQPVVGDRAYGRNGCPFPGIPQADRLFIVDVPRRRYISPPHFESERHGLRTTACDIPPVSRDILWKFGSLSRVAHESEPR